MRSQHLRSLVLALHDEFYIDEEMIAESIQSNSSFNIIHRETMFKVDVFIPRSRPFLQSQLTRAQRQSFSPGTEISAKFASPEDTILAKLEWYRIIVWGEKSLKDNGGMCLACSKPAPVSSI